MTSYRSLESLHRKHWSFRNTKGVFLWGMSNHWLSITPWTDNGRKLPYVGVDRGPYENLSRAIVLLGPFMLQILWNSKGPTQ